MIVIDIGRERVPDPPKQSEDRSVHRKVATPTDPYGPTLVDTGRRPWARHLLEVVCGLRGGRASW